MQRPSGTAAVRLSLWTVLMASFAMALVQPVQAQATPGTLYFTNTVVRTDSFSDCGDISHFALSDVPPAEEGSAYLALGLVALGCPANNFEFTAATAFTLSGDGQVTFNLACDFLSIISPGIEGQVTSIDIDLLKNGEAFSTNNFLFGEPTACGVADPVAVSQTAPTANTAFEPGDVLGIAIQVTWLNPDARLVENGQIIVGGEAPAVLTAVGLPTSGSTPPTNPNDLDGDGLNDTWEQQYFDNITAQNGTGDPDNDGLNNTAEQELGTDPTKADTDGDGVNDKEDPFPTDPTRGGTNGTSSTSTTTRPPTSTGTSTSRTTTGSVQQGGDGEGDVESFGDAVEKLRSDPGYLGLSGGGFLAVLILCIIGLAVRWSL